jgi:hypothetical protein
VCDTTLRYCAPRNCLPVRNHGPSQASSFRAGQALSLRQAPRHTERHKKSRLAFFVSLAVKDGELSERLIDSVESTHHWGTPDRSKAVPEWTCRITPRPSGVIESVLPTASFIATTAKFTDTGEVTSKSLAEQGNTALVVT